MNRTYQKLTADEVYNKLYNTLIQDPENKEDIERDGLEKAVTRRFNKENSRSEILETLLYNAHETFDSLGKDLKISFDRENVIVDYNGAPLLGLQTIKDFNFVGVYAGGDWEAPVFFILYYDDKNKLRAYIPSDGNPYDRVNKEAWGNGEENVDDPEYDFDWAKIENDIKKRFGL